MPRNKTRGTSSWGFHGTRLVNGLKQARRDGDVTRTEEDVIAENARLRRENQELRDTNELLKAPPELGVPNPG